MHADLDYFYAQCEENLDTTIRGKPVIVCVYSGRTEESGVVSTCNYKARNFGVKAGLPIVRAKKIMEGTDAVFLPVNRQLYEKVSDRIMEILRKYADNFEKTGIDEAYLDVSESVDENFNEAKSIALQIKKEIVQSEQITCSIGIGPNKLIAKIASDENKPDGITAVPPQEVDAFMSKLSVGRIPGVGKKVEEKLSQLHVQSVKELSALNANILVETFGRSLGSYLYKAARGEDDEPVKDKDRPIQISRIATLKNNTANVTDILPLLAELAHSVNAKLIEENLACKTIGIIAITENLKIQGKSKTIDTPTSDESTIVQCSRELLEQFLQTTPNTAIRRIGVKLSGLSTKSGQMNLSQFLS